MPDGKHVHRLKDGQFTGPDQITFEGDHIHALPGGVETTSADEAGPTHTHSLPDGSKTPSGPIPEEAAKKEQD